MTADLTTRVISSDDPTWPTQVEALRAWLGAPDNPTLLPPHFLKATFPRLGGRLIAIERASEALAAAFLFPRGITADRVAFTARLHSQAPLDAASRRAVGDALRQVLPDAGEIELYDPTTPGRYPVAGAADTPLRIARPTPFEALAIRELQRRIWRGDDDYLYPADIHGLDFPLGTSLIAAIDRHPVGFLFGFYRVGGPPLPASWQAAHPGRLRVESQLLGVLPEMRGQGVAFRLKEAQANQALADGIAVISWTADPLQLGNALLNFERLGAIAADFHPDFYAFRNDLNRVAASRLGLTWLIGSSRVRRRLRDRQPLQRGRRRLESARLLNRGHGPVSSPGDDALVAIEIPIDWSRLQRERPDDAAAWRANTDAFFASALGLRPGGYVVTGAELDDDRAYLLVRRVDDAGLAELAT